MGITMQKILSFAAILFGCVSVSMDAGPPERNRARHSQQASARSFSPGTHVKSTPYLTQLQHVTTQLDSFKALGKYTAADSASVQLLQKMQTRPGTEDVHLTPFLLETGHLQCEMGSYQEAYSLFQRVLGMESDGNPMERRYILSALRGIAIALAGLGKVAAAEDSARSCVDLSRELYGENDARHAEDLAIRAGIRIRQDRLRDAAGLLDRAIQLVEDQWGVEQEELADYLYDRASILNSVGKYRQALPLFERSAAINTKHWGRDHPKTAVSRLGIASIFDQQGEFAEARTLYGDILNTTENAFGPAHPYAVDAAIGLSTVLGDLGDYAKAENILRRCLEATIGEYGEKHATSAGLMLNLADVLAMLGKHVESTQLFRRTAALAEEIYGPNHTQTVAALYGLAHTLRRISRQVDAEPLYRRCIRIIEENHGSPHPDNIRYRGRLGMCIFEAGKADEGIESIKNGIAEANEIYGADCYQAALQERQLAKTYHELRQWENAIPIYKHSLSVLDKFFGPDHPFLSKCLKGLAQVYYEIGPLDEAIMYANRAVATHENNEGRPRLELAHLLRVKALIEMDAGQWNAAAATLLRGGQLALAVQQESYQLSCSSEALLQCSLPWRFARMMMTVVESATHESDSLIEQAFPLLVRTHGHVLDWLAERQRMLETFADTSQVRRLQEANESAGQRIVDLIINKPVIDQDEFLKRLAGARRDEEITGRALSSAIEHLRMSRKQTPGAELITLQALAAALDSGTTLVHFMRFPKWLSPRMEGIPNHTSNYGVFRLRKIDARSWDLDFVDLGNARSLDTLIFDYRDCIDGMTPGRRPTAKEESVYRSIARRLYDRIWAPVMDPIDTREHDEPAPMVLIVPNQWFYLLDFNTLLSPEDELVIERWKVHLLSSAGDLLRLTRERPPSRGMLAVGNPTYSSPPTGNNTAAAPDEYRSSPILCEDAYRPPKPLPGAEREIRIISEQYAQTTGESVTLLLGAEAVEDSVKHLLSGKRIVHLATHGFYCGELPKQYPHITAALNDNPLLMSGLVLASGGGEDDGLLTAQEIVCLNLQNVDWAVLSACVSGLGRLVQNEGLFGLRRAFEIAGVRTVVMALWRIDDTCMRELMVEMYKRRLAGSSTVDALRGAQLERFREQKRRSNRIHPVLWGGIVAQGDWR
jgi:CHAT domain-containing protein/tetratricopeptide (TPR) repeat protein